MKSFITILRKTKTIDADVLRAMGVFLAIISFGSLVYRYLEGWTMLDSIYFSVITLTTIGYGDLHPVSQGSKIFTIFYALIGVGLVFYIFTTIAKHLFEDEKKEIQRLDRTLEHLEALLAAKKEDKK